MKEEAESAGYLTTPPTGIGATELARVGLRRLILAMLDERFGGDLDWIWQARRMLPASLNPNAAAPLATGPLGLRAAGDPGEDRIFVEVADQSA